MSTNTSEQHQPAARQMMSIEDVVEVAPYQPWSHPRTVAAARMMGIENAEDTTEVASFTLSSLKQMVSPLTRP
jgi:hypothetical protein